MWGMPRFFSATSTALRAFSTGVSGFSDLTSMEPGWMKSTIAATRRPSPKLQRQSK